jgi:hypothetical protein
MQHSQQGHDFKLTADPLNVSEEVQDLKSTIFCQCGKNVAKRGLPIPGAIQETQER